MPCFLSRRFMRQVLASARNRRHQQNAVTFLERAGFPSQEAYVFFIEVNVEELPDLPLLVAHVPRQVGVARRQFVQSFGHSSRATVYLWRAVGEPAEGRWNFDSHGH